MIFSKKIMKSTGDGGTLDVRLLSWESKLLSPILPLIFIEKMFCSNNVNGFFHPSLELLEFLLQNALITSLFVSLLQLD